MSLSFPFVAGLLMPYPKDTEDNKYNSPIQRAGVFPLFDTNIILYIEKYHMDLKFICSHSDINFLKRYMRNMNIGIDIFYNNNDEALRSANYMVAKWLLSSYETEYITKHLYDHPLGQRELMKRDNPSKIRSKKRILLWFF